VLKVSLHGFRKSARALAADTLAATLDPVRKLLPMGRLGTPTDIGNAVALICSPEANWITGQLIDVDGGASLMDARLPLEFQGVAKPRKAEAA
jgi:NAD(P)-dependent dehydrogenase (short-subunit alcohol dehydrogenase family)